MLWGFLEKLSKFSNGKILNPYNREWQIGKKIELVYFSSYTATSERIIKINAELAISFFFGRKTAETILGKKLIKIISCHSD